MAVRPIWRESAAIAKEASYGVSPSNQRPYFGDGSYFMLPAEKAEIIGHMPKTSSAARTGYREAQVYAPIPGNKRGEGNVIGPALPDSLGLLLLLALGQATTTQTADAANPLANAIDLTSSPLTVTDPTTSAFLEFDITAYNGSSTTITITGTDANGRTVTETLTVVGTGKYYSRYNYNTLTSVTTSGFTATSTATINGYVKSVHVFTLADNPLSATIINKGDPGRGSSQSGFAAGCVLQQLKFTLDANTEAGLFTFDSQFKGKYPTYASEPTFYVPVDRAMAGWQMSVTIGGVSYYKVASFTVTIATGNDVIWSADGTQNPRYMIGNEFKVTGQMTLITEDDTEFGYFEDGTELDFTLTVENTNDALDATNNKGLVIELTRMHFMNATPQDLQGAQALQVDFEPIRDSSDGVLKATLTNSVYSY